MPSCADRTIRNSLQEVAQKKHSSSSSIHVGTVRESESEGQAKGTFLQLLMTNVKKNPSCYFRYRKISGKVREIIESYNSLEYREVSSAKRSAKHEKQQQQQQQEQQLENHHHQRNHDPHYAHPRPQQRQLREQHEQQQQQQQGKGKPRMPSPPPEAEEESPYDVPPPPRKREPRMRPREDGEDISTKALPEKAAARARSANRNEQVC